MAREAAHVDGSIVRKLSSRFDRFEPIAVEEGRRSPSLSLEFRKGTRSGLFGPVNRTRWGGKTGHDGSDPRVEETGGKGDGEPPTLTLDQGLGCSFPSPPLAGVRCVQACLQITAATKG